MRRDMVRDYLMMRKDGRNPYGAKGGYVRDSRRGGYDRNYRDYGNSEYDSRRGDMAYSQQDMARGRRDYESGRQYDMARGSYDMRGQNYKGEEVYSREEMDGHYEQGKRYMPVEAMGTFTGYYGMEDGFYPRVRQGRDYGDYDDMRGGDYGENLSKEELEHWNKKLMREIDDKEKQFFNKQAIEQKAKQLGIQMKDYSAEELAVATAMVYTDYCKTLKAYVGNNMDVYIKLARDWLEDEDSSVQGAEKLSIYHDCIISEE